MREQANYFLAAVGLLAAIWGMTRLGSPADGSWVHPAGSPPGRVRIIEFRASVGTLQPGETAQLCYGVENAQSVRISPMSERVDPALNRCMDVEPTHTTHYTILAIGYDGSVATRSLTLPVQVLKRPTPERVEVALI